MLPVTSPAAMLLDIQQRALFAGFGIAVEETVVNFAVPSPLGFVAQLVFPQQTMIQHMMGGDGGIKIRRQIQVKRDLNIFRLCFAIDADGRIEKAGQATVIDRKTVIRKVHYRHASDAQATVPRRTKSGFLIECQLVGGNVPIVFTGFTEGESGTFHGKNLVARGADATGTAAQVSLGNHIGAAI